MADLRGADHPFSDMRLEYTPGSVLYAMQLAAFERLSPDTFAAANALPAWFLRLTAVQVGSDPALRLTDHFPALEGFLPAAEEFWADGSVGPLQSDFWTETDAEGNEDHLLAFAAREGARNFLVLERANATFIEHQQLQLYAHEMATQYETIAQLNKEVERTTAAKTALLATMSHEIRAPLNTILEMAGLLAESHLDNLQGGHVDVARRAAANLLSLLDAILDRR